jgi:hypothetical protein
MRQAREQLASVAYCHLCDCLIGWLHNATEHWKGEFIPHEPFLEDECPTCWIALAHTEHFAEQERGSLR